MGYDARTIFRMVPLFYLASPLCTFYPVNFRELCRSPTKGSGFLAGNVARLLDPEHPCSEANSLPRVTYFLQVLFID